MSTTQRDTVLIVDDDENFRELVKVVAEIQGVRLLEAPECATALSLIQRESQRIRLVMLDYYMPDMTPADCVSGIRLVAQPDVEIVLVTAAVNPSTRAAEIGLKRWLSKPCEVNALENLLNEGARQLPRRAG